MREEACRAGWGGEPASLPPRSAGGNKEASACRATRRSAQHRQPGEPEVVDEGERQGTRRVNSREPVRRALGPEKSGAWESRVRPQLQQSLEGGQGPWQKRQELGDEITVMEATHSRTGSLVVKGQLTVLRKQLRALDEDPD
ncbi:hypothetical protein NDU88_000763 [Pleurodeles waltl]|uniref:Uncharacterized protein n=1 Tax=Pleurodeles waltl TaxID=8319 RepID=A0AAV7UV01_PLEWA|nr:hypothetical protein NDU88_000763 [Pleurodeles waltl]